MKRPCTPAANRRREAADLARSRLAVLCAQPPARSPVGAPPASGRPVADEAWVAAARLRASLAQGLAATSAVTAAAGRPVAAPVDRADRAARSGSRTGGPTPVPDGWPYGYGYRAEPDSSAATSPVSAVSVAAAPASAVRGPSPGAPPDPDLDPDSDLDPDPDPDLDLDLVSDLTPVHVERRSRFRLPAALHSLLLADRKAVLGLTVLLLLAVGYAAQHFWFGRPQAVAVPLSSARPVARAVPQAALAPAPALDAAPAPVPDAVPVAAPDAAPLPAASAAAVPGSGGQALPPVVIDIAGRVAHPGIRALPSGARVADALRAAGGALPGVDTDTLNLARVLVDGEQVLVGAPSPAVQGGPAPPAPKPPVSLNRATLDQLDALPGVGPVLARHILDFRGTHGLFQSLDQLRLITGIGERKLAELKPLVTL
ncbi:helix-hairpin-helix domain-containing protein [Kitasatospora sp. NBC_01287]|uniref:helix-hairpin-helix domain-containing protein n=1 Tax=Kitasatospora sp. NBC_01287 TaxID=2903573 RepID=UPI00225A4782|nr:helix-hairpin-helix domain-containing protein [Kitasatospora sp. NBC_01287]MCX4749036.1 helix-hairpin-helix domain-containing protein [Kitasatospora sp. NBC_01287]